MAFLGQYPEGAIIDEIQRVPWQSLPVYGGEIEQLRQDSKVIRLFSLAEHLENIDQ